MLKAIHPQHLIYARTIGGVGARVHCSRWMCSTASDPENSSGRFVISGTLTTAKSAGVGQYAEVEHVFTQEAVNRFSAICGDNNPLHVDPAFAQSSMFGGTIVHGILVSSLFSTLFGRAIHGSIYVSQSLHFKRPVFVGASVRAKMEIVSVDHRAKGSLLTCTTTCCLLDGTLAVVGEAKVLLPQQLN
jgi:acyl dehydratase